ncbi:hypothetical protein CFIO01_04873 [Colletotrichum fioriniae PJ7]|uniref:Uncharacterized protein n=1 Tax=Colletotrichum fioriniae PJ7 TaxID=1445577 RepID=A0A010SGU5_9PEZI|nr:hypothetical protein CFIO01_04873 [Colletotrichum fioriniae PJ7]
MSLSPPSIHSGDCPRGISAQCIGYNHNITSISSSTITRVNGSVILAYDGWITGLSFPELRSVGENFVLHKLESLKYLDVDQLESVGYMRLMYAPKLTTLKLSAFRNITGITYHDGLIERSMELGLGGLESLDAFFKEPQLSVDQVYIYNSGKVERLQIGAAKIGTLKFDYVSYGGPNNLTLVLGGSDITEQTIGSIKTTYSLNGIERLANLKTLSVGSFDSYGGNFYQHLDLPFDHLGNLTIMNERELMWLSVPPQASQWVNFSLNVQYNNANLNLSTEYRVSDNGEMVRSWYWPQPDMGQSYLRGNLSNLFFDSYFQFRNALSKETLANRKEDLHIYAEGSFSCEPFERLNKKTHKQFYVSCSAHNLIALDSGGSARVKLLALQWVLAGAIILIELLLV